MIFFTDTSSPRISSCHQYYYYRYDHTNSKPISGIVLNCIIVPQSSQENLNSPIEIKTKQQLDRIENRFFVLALSVVSPKNITRSLHQKHIVSSLTIFNYTQHDIYFFSYSIDTGRESLKKMSCPFEELTVAIDHLNMHSTKVQNLQR